MKHACRHATRLASESLDRRLSLLERLRFHLHLAICKNCRHCDETLQLIHRTSELMRETRYGEIRLSDEQRNRLHRAIDDQLGR